MARYVLVKYSKNTLSTTTECINLTQDTLRNSSWDSLPCSLCNSAELERVWERGRVVVFTEKSMRQILGQAGGRECHICQLGRGPEKSSFQLVNKRSKASGRFRKYPVEICLYSPHFYSPCVDCIDDVAATLFIYSFITSPPQTTAVQSEGVLQGRNMFSYSTES